MDTKIIVAAHKQYKMPDSKMYIPLQVGAKGKESIGYVRDDKGDNISDKNPTYCELTGMYYAWKNMSADYIGLVHYRRYFASNAKCSKDDPFENVLTPEEVRYYMSGYDIIVPNKRKYYIESLYSHYDHTFDGRHLKIAYTIIAEHYPKYKSACHRVYHRSWGYMFNMFITSKKLWDEYCTWLFDILGRMEKYIDLSKYDEFESRLFGRISEILFNVWLDYHINRGLKAVEVKCIHMEPVDWITKGSAFLKAKFFGHKYTKSF